MTPYEEGQSTYRRMMQSVEHERREQLREKQNAKTFGQMEKGYFETRRETKQKHIVRTLGIIATVLVALYVLFG